MSEDLSLGSTPHDPAGEFAYDVGLEDFEARVLRPSFEVPILVDFWAPWCAPCRALKPVLEKLAAEYGGRFLLARVNSDEFPQIAQHFGVRSIPTVKVIKEGRLADEFNGALPEGEVRAFIERLLPPSAASEREQAALLSAEGRFEEALALLLHALQANPGDEALRLDSAEILFELGRLDEVAQLLDGEFEQENDRARTLRARLDLAAAPVDPDQLGQLQAKIAADPDDHAARLELSAAQAAGGDYRAALESALEVVRRDRNFGEDAGRKAMLRLFEALGGNARYDDLVREYRRQLSAALN
ncbi:MAG: Thioredoxin-1 [Betaproteobacteria bacterium ADurb.Bin341]|nr:MAG: Thioredoxin-1 [Betaproteobacteria bacterium ADurb.Bin341]